MLEALLGLLPPLGRLLNDASKKRRLLDDRGQTAVEAILRAVNETKLYLSARSRGSLRDTSREDELSRHWTDTAARLHGIDEDLAQRCRLKGEYWTDPEKWDAQQLGEAHILLTQVSTDADTLLGWQRTKSGSDEEKMSG